MKIIHSRGTTAFLCAGAVGLIALAIVLPTSAQQNTAKQAAPAKQATKSHYVSPPGFITGTVTGDNGPEAGVWVIAQTSDLGTPMIKTVVTDDQGRYLVPELPVVNYKLWVRGYGIEDSKPIDTRPSANPVALKVTNAKSPAEAAQVYPGDYWLSLLAPPAKNLFPGTGEKTAANPDGNGLDRGMLDQDHWINRLKSGCNFCHQLGNTLDRDVKHVWDAKPDLEKTHVAAWEWRLETGVRGNSMYSTMTGMGKTQTLKSLAEWTEGIANGTLLPPIPPRPSGIERNIVSTQWDVGDDHSFMHDQISTDKNHPDLNGGGPNYAVNAGHGQLVILDQADNYTYALDIPTREGMDKVPSRFPAPVRPSFFWGDEHLWSNPPYDPADPHNPMMDSKGRVWLTSKIRGNTEPSWCNDGSSKYSDWYPLRNSARQASYFDPKTKQFQLIETCYSTHHVVIDNDPNETVYFNELSGPIFGWIDSKVYDQTLAATHDESQAEKAAVGWCAQTVDTNGDGKITRPWNVIGRNADLSNLYNTDTGGGAVAPRAPAPAAAAPPAGRGAADGAGAGGGRAGGRGRGAAAPAAPFDPKLDAMVSFSLYSTMPSPVDDSVWGVDEDYPGFLVRLQRGNNPPESCRTQVFKVPAPGYDPRGIDVDSQGVVWTGLAATSHLASFDVRKCKDLTGPQKIDGSQCKEGWTLYQTPGPKLKGTDVPADFHYFNWTDSHNIMQMGKDTPFLTGSDSDSLIALDPATKKWTYFTIPYPLGFYARGMDGRIDDANAGWKGRALYSNYGTHFVWQVEGGKGTKGKIVKFQLRPNPLAR
jgi:hypothetical protein